MAKIIIMPKLGFTQEEGKLVAWHKNVGDSIKKGEAFFDVHTDKSVVTIEAAEDGTLLKIAAELNETLPVFTPIAVVGAPGEDAEAALKAHVMDVAPDAAVKADFDDEEKTEKTEAEDGKAGSAERLKLTPKARKLVEEEGYDPETVRQVKGTGFEGGITYKDIKASPLARKLAEREKIDLSEIAGSGPSGKIKKQDVLQKKESEAAAGKTSDLEKKILATLPYDGIRRVIGQRLSESKFTAPHLYFTDEIDVGKLNAFRIELNEKSEIKISFTDLLVAAVSRALSKYPEVNSSLQGNEIIQYESTNIGVAVGGEQGLIVPVVKNAQQKKLTRIASETKDLIARAREGKLSPEEYQGGTFTVSNLGMFGIKNFTAIINPPEAAILAVSAARKTPVVIQNEAGEDEIVIRQMMNIQLSVDHRIIDGLLAAQFVAYLKELLEEPVRILI